MLGTGMKPRTCQRHFQCQGWPRLFPGRPSCTDAKARHIGVGTVGVSGWYAGVGVESPVPCCTDAEARHIGVGTVGVSGWYTGVRVESPVPCLWALP